MKFHPKSSVIFAAALLLGAAAAALPAQAQVTKTQLSELRLEPTGDDIVHDTFGFAVAIDGDTMVIGAQAGDGIGFDTGVAYIFERSADGWVQTAKLFANDAHVPLRDAKTPELPAKGQHADEFASTVAISGDTVAVGAHGRFNSLGQNNTGVVYVFQRVAGAWIQQAELSSPAPSNGSNFGLALGISGVTIVVGDVGGPANFFTPNVDVFTRTNGTWTLTTTLTVPDDFAFQPDSVAIAGHTVVVGSTGSDAPSAFGAGAAYVFRLMEAGPMAGTWVPQATLTAADAASEARFGISLSVSDNLIAVGADLGPGATPRSGAAYVFAGEAGGWSQKAKLIAGDGADSDEFGLSVSVSGAAVLVGAFNHGQSGSAYVYMRRIGTWSQVAEVAPSDGFAGAFGGAVAIQDTTLLIGADNQHKEPEGYAEGEAYVYRLNP
jgi:FG-GAP repeat protein